MLPAHVLSSGLTSIASPRCRLRCGAYEMWLCDVLRSFPKIKLTPLGERRGAFRFLNLPKRDFFFENPPFQIMRDLFINEVFRSRNTLPTRKFFSPPFLPWWGVLITLINGRMCCPYEIHIACFYITHDSPYTIVHKESRTVDRVPVELKGYR